MSVVKFDLSNSSIERNELSAVVDSKAILAKLVPHEAVNALLDLESNESIYWTSELQEYLGNEFGLEEVTSGNTYNHESDLSDTMQWCIVAPKGGELYSEGILLVQLHHGGDPRGNYGSVRAYKWQGEDSFFFLDTVAGYYVTDPKDPNASRVDNSLTQRFESGYTANPGYELRKNIVKILELNEQSAKIELSDGSTVLVYPEHSANYN